jgi:hypothetical protein
LQKVLIISFSMIRNDPRVMRQIRLLESQYDLTVLGFGEKPDARCTFIPVRKKSLGPAAKFLRGMGLFLGAHETYYWGQYHVRAAEEQLRDTDADLILANDLSALPLALRCARGRPVLYDAHEYAPGEYADALKWRLTLGRLNRAFCAKYLKQTSSMLTVCQGIADEYARNYHVRPKVVHNAPSLQHLSPSPVRNGAVRMIHHGVASSVRKLEQMIEIMNELDDRFSLDLMLVEEDPGYMTHLRQLARSNPRIRFVAPVPMPQICARINDYDVGLYLLPPDNFNHQHALPNKFFEFVQARLAVAIGPSPEMAALVHRYGCGIVADSFEPGALVRALSALDASSLAGLKRASDKAAQLLCFEHEAKVIEDEMRALLT